MIVTARLDNAYGGLKVTLEGEPDTIANWIHENMSAGHAALSVRELPDWKHNDPRAVARIRENLERGDVFETYPYSQDWFVVATGFSTVETTDDRLD